MHKISIIAIGIILSGCVSENFEHLATQAAVRVSTVNGELTKISESSKLAAGDRAHYAALLEETAQKLQIEADREFNLRQALDLKDYQVFVEKLLAGADRSAAKIASLDSLRDKMETDIQAKYQELVLHSQELSKAAKDLGQLGMKRKGKEELEFLFQFAMDLSKAYADTAGNAKQAQDTISKNTAQKSKVQVITSTMLARGPAMVIAGPSPIRRKGVPDSMAILQQNNIKLNNLQENIETHVQHPLSPLY